MIRKKAYGLFRLVRFELPLAAGICVVLGELLAAGRLPAVRAILLGFFSVFFISAATLVLNDFFDLEIDRVNSPQRPLPAGLVTPRDVVVFSLVLTLVGLLAGGSISLAALAAVTLAWVVGFLYNWRFKRSGLPGNLMVSFSVGFTFIFGGIVEGRPFERMAWFFGILAALLDLGEEIAVDALDVEGDRRAGSRSLAVVLGGEVALRIGAAIFLLLVLVTVLAPAFGWLTWIDSLPFLLMDGVIVYSTGQFLRTGQPNRRRYTRWIYLSASAAVAVYLVMRVLGV